MRILRDGAPPVEVRRRAADALMRASGLEVERRADGSRNFYSATVEDRVMRLSIRGPIDDGYGVDVNRIIGELERAGPLDRIEMQLATPGGFADDGLVLYHALRVRGDAGTAIAARATGIIASAGIAIWLAADERMMPPGTTLMTHECQGFICEQDVGERLRMLGDLRARGCEAIDATYRAIAVARCGLDDEHVARLDKAETWMQPDEAMKLGYATEVQASGEGDNGKGEEADANARNLRLQRAMLRIMATRGGETWNPKS